MKKWAEDQNRHFSKDNMQMDKKRMKRYSTLLIIRKMQIITTMTLVPHTSQNGHHQKNLQTVNAGEDVEKREPYCTVGGNVNRYSHYGERYGDFLAN